MSEFIKVMMYDNTKHEYPITDIDHLRGCLVKVLSGDHIVTPIYEDGHIGPTMDPGRYSRFDDFYDGERFFDAAYIDEYNKLKTTYDLFEAPWSERTGIVESAKARRKDDENAD